MPPVPAGDPVVRVSSIRKTYGRTVAVDDVSFEVRAGEIFGLIGPNDARPVEREPARGSEEADAGEPS